MGNWGYRYNKARQQQWWCELQTSSPKISPPLLYHPRLSNPKPNPKYPNRYLTLFWVWSCVSLGLTSLGFVLYTTTGQLHLACGSTVSTVMESFGFSDTSKTARKKRSSSSRRPRSDSQPFVDCRENSDNVSSDENNGHGHWKKELNLNQCSSRASSTNLVEAGTQISRRISARYTSFPLGQSDVASDAPGSEKKVKKVKLKVGGVTRTIHADSTPSGASMGGSSNSSVAPRPRPKLILQEISDDDHSSPDKGSGLRGVQWKGYSSSGLSVMNPNSLRGKNFDESVSTKQDKFEPVRKSKRVPKKRSLDGAFDDEDEDDEELRYLEKLKFSKLATENSAEYESDDEVGSRKRHKISKVLNRNGAVRSSVDAVKKSRSVRAFTDTEYVEEEQLVSDGEPETKKKKKQRKELVDDLGDGKREMAITTRQRALQSVKHISSNSGASVVEFPNGLPPAPRKQKEKLSEVEQQLKKAEVAQRRRMQTEKAARESEAEAIRKILGQDSSRKKREDKLKQRQEELAQERATNAMTLASNTVRWLLGPTGSVVTFPNEMGLPSIFEPKACSYPPPREKCAGPSCTNAYKYRDSKSKVPLCSLQCYKAIHEKMQPDFQGFLNDLQDWEMSVDGKDKKVRSKDRETAKLVSSSQKVGVVGEDRRPMAKPSTSDNSSTSRQYDYLRNYDSIRNLSSGFVTETSSPDAASEKELGNEYFKQKKFNEAIDCYSRSIALSPTAVAYANRAMAYLKIRRQVLRFFSMLLKTFCGSNAEFALRLEPNNEEVKRQCAEAKSLYNKELLKKASGALRSSVQGVEKAGKSKVEVNGHVRGVQSVSSSSQKVGAAAIQEDSNRVIEDTGGQVRANTPTPVVEIESRSTRSKGQETDTSHEDVVQSSPLVSYKRNQRNKELKASVQELAARAASLAKVEAAKNITPPNSAYQFEASWRGLAGDRNLQARLLKVTSPVALPQIFKNALSAPLLIDIVRCIATFFTEEMDLSVNYLENLAKVLRFDMIIMCLSSAERADLHRIWDDIFCSNATPIEYAERLDKLRSRYCPKQ
ncbi:hypothetical protein RHMOL_Rhmol11G0155500 [Rhododendron molle]|uniref:Uncharacterized protein n=1 Tax=Rhododendron molle TaxID=49168 RepID=A0ACC0LSR0_RHOML|nr:hypothetical protein RHMOL_Rhmol11G0155500 [Rhododendron molle]